MFHSHESCNFGLELRGLCLWRDWGPSNIAFMTGISVHPCQKILHQIVGLRDFWISIRMAGFLAYEEKIEKVCKNGGSKEAFQMANTTEVPISRDVAYLLLQECVKNKDAEGSRKVQCLMVLSGLDSIAILGDHLLRHFASHGSLPEVNQGFHKISAPSIYTWNAIIVANAKLGCSQKALELYEKMQLSGTKSNEYVYTAALKACANIADLRMGKLIHEEVFQTGIGLDIAIGSTLIDMYAKCGALEEGRNVFDKLQGRDLIAWGAIISGYSQHGHALSALELFNNMQQEKVKPDAATFLCALKACGSTEDLGQGRLIHERIIRQKMNFDAILGNAVIDMYFKCKGFNDVQVTFDQLEKRDVITWGLMVAGYAQHGHSFLALELFKEMRQNHVHPDRVILLSILKACANLNALQCGRLIHSEIINRTPQLDGAGGALVEMYAKCGSLNVAQNIFDNLPGKDVSSWCVMITEYCQSGYSFTALELFNDMQNNGMYPNKGTFLSILRACANIGNLELGRLMHNEIIIRELGCEACLGNALLDMYVRCGSIVEAHHLFDHFGNRELISWNTIIDGHVKYGHNVLALQLFHRMQYDGIKADKFTFLSSLKACGRIGAIHQGKMMHDNIIEIGLETDIIVGSTLVHMYAKCGWLQEARETFDKLPNRNVVTWGALITGYAQHGHGILALEMFEEMQENGIKADKVIFLTALRACTTMGAVEKGSRIHDQINQSDIELDIVLANSLIDMYAKCGDLNEAHKVFDRLQNQDVVSWGAMIAGYAQYGNIGLAKKCLEDMNKKGVRPNDMTFNSVIAACSHVGSVNDGCKYFRSMRADHDVEPNVYHWNCMIDLLGRTGCLNEAEDLLQARPNIIGWLSLLTSCRTYGNLDLGRRCFNEIRRLDMHNAASYVLMSDIYANAQMWNEAGGIEELRKHSGAWKKPAKAWIELNQKIHEFVVGGKTHPQTAEIHATLKMLNNRMKEEGYIPQLILVRTPKISPRDMEDALCGHCEKLAIGFGVMSLPKGRTIRITKNIRVCIDCHSASKIISRIERREIIIRDAYRIHIFKEGECSCGDYF